jgi:hypothetical protein
MEDLCIVIPTMSRKTTGLEYVKETLAANTPILNSCNTCIYVNQTDYEMLKGYLAEIFHTVIPRTEDDSALEHLRNDKYAYWRSHLCMDFFYSMEQATHRFPNCKYFMWLEDDVFLHPNFEEVWANKGNFVWTHNGHGATCMIFEKTNLLSIVIPNVKSVYLEDAPIDGARYDNRWGHPTHLSKKIAFHIGVSSSQEGCIRHENDRAEYSRLKGITKANSRRA